MFFDNINGYNSDSPILVKYMGKEWPNAVFPPHTPEDLERLRASNMFLMVNLAPVSDAKDKAEFSKEITQKGDILIALTTLSLFFFFDMP